jgi:predicted ATP-dependent endonuclease of OLD family
MKLIDIRIRNFRSIEAEQHLKIPGRMTLVGPNNSGKTNILKAIRMLFTGYSNIHGYTQTADLTFNSGRVRTSITASFDGAPDTDASIYSDLDELHRLQQTSRDGKTEFSLNLYFTETNTPVYSLFPNVKRPQGGTPAANYSRIHKSLVERILNTFSLHYVPSAKSVNEIYEDLLSPFIKKRVAKVITPYISDIQNSLNEAAHALNDELGKADLSHINASFSLPSESLERLLSGFDFLLSDPQKTSVHEKGMGIQTTALLAALRWITKEETDQGKSVLWLLEEPESYLHPQLASSCSVILDNLAKDAIVVKTTHAMAFVPQDPNLVSGILLNTKNKTEIKQYKTFSDATSSIRASLGVRFSDFYNLAEYNVFVEGQSDREIFQWVLSKLPEEEYNYPYLRKAKFEDFGGTPHLGGFLRATYEFIRRECHTVTVLDGDDAGDKLRRDLQSYFGQKDIPFQPNKNYVSVRKGFAIEGLFPDQWIQTIYAEHPTWFENYSVDASGQLEPFRIKDAKKPNMQNRLLSMAEEETDLEWAARFIEVLSIINSALKDA